MRSAVHVVLILVVCGSFLKPARAEEMKLGAHRGGPLPEGLGIIDEKCVACHNRQRIESAIRKNKDMIKIQKRMEVKGVALTENERSVLSHVWRQNPFRGEGEKRKEEPLPKK